MKKQVIDLAGIKKSSTVFNHVVQAGNFIFLSSQLSTNLKTGEIIKGNIKKTNKKSNEQHKISPIRLRLCDG